MQFDDMQGWQVGQIKTIDGVPCTLIRKEVIDRRRDVALVWHATRPDGSETAAVQLLPAGSAP